MKKKIAVINIEGVIQYSSNPKSDYCKWIDAIDRVLHKKLKAVIVRINSPGGTLGASYEIFKALDNLKINGIKVISLMEDVAASGGLYISMAADKIITSPGTVTGSIGVILQAMDRSDLAQWAKVKFNTIKSGKYKDLGNAYRPMTEDDKFLLQGIVDDAYLQFVECVALARGMNIEDVKKIADGRWLTGRQAVGLHLVDYCGDLAFAHEIAALLSGENKSHTKLVNMDKKPSFLSKFSIKKLLGIQMNIPMWLMPN